MDQIPGRFAGKGVLGISGTKQVITINNGAAGRGKNCRRAERADASIAVTDDRTNRKNSSRSFENIPLGTGRHEMGIATQIMIVQDKVENWIRIVTAKPVAPIVSVSAVLGLARYHVDLSCIRIDADIATPHINSLLVSYSGNFASAASVGQIDPMVQSVNQGH